MIKESELTAELLADKLTMLLSDKKRLHAMAISAKQHAKPEAAEVIAEICTAVSYG
jgi:UDP-N-acetylglucosamine:LPS N-acetylglucosamine transferase